MGTLGVHGKGRQHRNMTLLVSPTSTVMPTTRFLDPSEKTSPASIDSCYGVGRSLYLRCVWRTLLKSKRCTQRGDMTSGRCQLFDETGRPAGPGVVEKCAQGCPDFKQWFPLLIPLLYLFGRSSENARRCRDNIDECILMTYVNGYFTWKQLQKNTNNGHF